MFAVLVTCAVVHRATTLLVSLKIKLSVGTLCSICL